MWCYCIHIDPTDTSIITAASLHWAERTRIRWCLDLDSSWWSCRRTCRWFLKKMCTAAWSWTLLQHVSQWHLFLGCTPMTLQCNNLVGLHIHLTCVVSHHPHIIIITTSTSQFWATTKFETYHQWCGNCFSTNMTFFQIHNILSFSRPSGLQHKCSIWPGWEETAWYWLIKHIANDASRKHPVHCARKRHHKNISFNTYFYATTLESFSSAYESLHMALYKCGCYYYCY